MVVIAVLLAVAIFMGFGADAYFLIRIGDWAAQVTLLVALFCVLVGALILQLCWRVFRGLFLGAWPGAWRRRKKQNLTQQVIEQLAMTNWTTARKGLIKLANQADQPAPWVMLAAEASESLGDFEQAKSVYEQALVEFPSWAKVIQSRLCHIALEEGELDTAEAHLVELLKIQKENTDIVFFRARLAEERNEWPELRSYLLTLQKKKHHHDGIGAMERRHISARLNAQPGAPELMELKDYALTSVSLPSPIIAKLVQQLAMRGLDKEAESLARKALGNNWSEELMDVYAELDGGSPKKQLRLVESWSSAHPDSPALLAGLQKLSLKAGDENRAEKYGAKLTDQTALELAETK